jgi:hypothetical protein
MGSVPRACAEDLTAKLARGAECHDSRQLALSVSGGILASATRNPEFVAVSAGR